jgi:hypothetical protein
MFYQTSKGRTPAPFVLIVIAVRKGLSVLRYRKRNAGG